MVVQCLCVYGYMGVCVCMCVSLIASLQSNLILKIIILPFRAFAQSGSVSTISMDCREGCELSLGHEFCGAI